MKERTIEQMQAAHEARMQALRTEGVASKIRARTPRTLGPDETPAYVCWKVWNGGVATKLWTAPKSACSEEAAKLRFLESLMENPGYTMKLHDNELWSEIASYILEWDREHTDEYLTEHYVQEHRTSVYGRTSDTVPKRWWETWKGGLDMAPNAKEG